MAQLLHFACRSVPLWQENVTPALASGVVRMAKVTSKACKRFMVYCVAYGCVGN